MNRKSIKPKIKMIVDMLMTIAMICLMSYSLIGEALHEIVGISMFTLFIVHHTLNASWTRNLFKGRYTGFRIWQTVLVALIFICMIIQMLSGIALSKHIFTFLGISFAGMFVRNAHMLGAYWGFILMALHLGLHLNTMMRAAKKNDKAHMLLRAIGIIFMCYGLYAFIKRGVLGYMFLVNMFVYFDVNEPLIYFFADYVTIMAAFAVIGHYVGKCLLTQGRKKDE